MGKALSIDIISDKFGKTFGVTTGYKTSGSFSMYNSTRTTIDPNNITEFGFESIHPRNILTELEQGFNYFVLGAITRKQYLARTRGRGINKAGNIAHAAARRQNPDLLLRRPFNRTTPSSVGGVYDDLPILRGLRSALGFGLDVGIGFGFQYWEDSYNPYLTERQRIGRGTISGLGGAGTASVFIAFACGLSGGLPCTIGAGVAGGI
ncbi:MAG: hypothetical protein GY796_29295, partial [Chloroflexi bacterium]|nr:hypothetical protein [Chloroflexota bacterium]